MVNDDTADEQQLDVADRHSNTCHIVPTLVAALRTWYSHMGDISERVNRPR